jgi:Bacterial PH domain
MAMPADNQVETPVSPAEPSLTSHLIVAPEGTQSGGPAAVGTDESPSAPASSASGIEAEETLWEGRYSLKNFVGRALLGGVLTVVWVALAVVTWWFGQTNLAFLSYVVGFVVLIFWVASGFKLLRAERSHHYRLTTRRLFVTTGFFHRLVDQVELVRVKDLYVRENMVGQWLGVGNVVLISSEETLPNALLLGIEEPRRVTDLIWHHTRLERDRRTTEVNHIW